MNFKIKFIYIALFFCSCSTYKIADQHTSHQLSKNGLHLKSLQSGNFNIVYWDSGGDKPVLILLHGFGASTQFQWYKQVGSLTDSYRVILPDLIYFGGSTVNSPISSVGEQVEAIQTLIDQLGIKTFSLCGVSYGGLVAAELALSNQEKIKKMILCDAPVKFMDENDIKLIYEKFNVKSFNELLVPDNYKKLKKLLSIAYLHPPKVPAFMLKSVYRNLYIKQAEGQNSLLNSLDKEKDLFANREYHYQLPVLLIWGAEDNLIPVKVGQELQKHIGANARLEIIPNTAHMANLEAPKAFNKIMIGFLKE
jgi:pimeloyl-ACP methyl ester carboxylesterase